MALKTGQQLKTTNPSIKKKKGGGRLKGGTDNYKRKLAPWKHGIILWDCESLLIIHSHVSLLPSPNKT